MPDLAQCLHDLRRISAEFCLAGDGAHGPDHSERVYRNALRIGQLMDARLDILTAAALLHDIGRGEETRSQGRICHAQVGAELAAPLLEQLGYSPADIAAICHCIGSHRFRHRGEASRSLEACILFDADKLDSIGAVGIGRAFLFAGSIGACLHNPEKDPALTMPYSSDDTAYREFCVKMSKVQEQMLTPPGRQLAEERHAFMEAFFAQLNREFF